MVRASREFQVFAKPGGAICNLNCRYCYYLNKERLYPDSGLFRMPYDLLESYIVQHIDASPGPIINFSWHGGEPTVLGLDYFRKIIDLERKHRPPGRRILNGIQTNGILLNEEWCRFLAAQGFSVGLSLDGPREMHDSYRVTRGGKSSHEEAVRAFRLLKRYRVPCDMLCVLHDQNVRYPAEVYRFFKNLGVRYIVFLPLVEPVQDTAGGVSTRTVPASAFGEFLCKVFDEWVDQDIGRIAIQMFEEAAAPALGLEHSLCVFRETCGDVPVIEHNGDFYPCDHFVDEPHRMGNIREIPLVELIESLEQRAFGQAKLDSLPRYCRECEFRESCNGGCPKDRLLRTPDGEEGLNYLCVGFKRFFTHYRLGMLSRSQARLSARQTLKPPGGADVGPFPNAGRNDPCPCGSGRKYKKCCLRHSE